MTKNKTRFPPNFWCECAPWPLTHIPGFIQIRSGLERYNRKPLREPPKRMQYRLFEPTNTSILAMVEIPCASLIGDCKRWVNLRLNFRLNGYVSRYYDITQFTLTYSMFRTPIARFRWSNIAFTASKTRSRHNKCVNSIPPAYTSQIMHFLVLTTSSEYLLIVTALACQTRSTILRGWVALRLNFRLKG